MSELTQLATSLPSARDRDFFRRVHSVDESVYSRRTEALGFTGLADVLDAGCGFGQWAAALASRNERVCAVDIDAARVEVTRKVLQSKGLCNAKAVQADISSLPFAAASFDGIFSYSVIYYSEHKATLREWHRLLRPGGLLYFSTNAVGWYLYNLITNHNASADFSPRRMAIRALGNTIRNGFGKDLPGESAMSPRTTRRLLDTLGFEVLAIGADGTLGQPDPDHPVRRFYPPRRYGLPNVFEVLCRKRIPMP